MPGLFVFAIILAILGVLGVATYAAIKVLGDPNDGDVAATRVLAAVMAGIFLAGALICTFASSFNSVGTYDIGVTTNFGKVIGYVGPGAHWIAPWENMALMDESVQPVNETLTVRVAGQQTAQATVKLRVQLVPSATDALFRQYKGNTQNVISALVQPELNVAMNSVYDGYDPILPLSTNAKPGTPDNPSTAQLSARVKATLTTALNGQVKVDTLVVQPLRYDQTVENRINSVLAQTAKTDVANEAIKTATSQARANTIAQTALNSNPLVLVQQCMNAIADGQLNPPAGFSCWPGSGSGVVIPSGK
jgi:regulator of protease activity HflC (stomatin/prohibitin superfamily)